MSLLQILEPGSSAKRGEVIGIDLGTTHSLVARFVDGEARIIADKDGNLLLPSVVHCASNGEILVGDEAQQMLTLDPENTISSIKRLMGLPSDAPETGLFTSVNRDKTVPRLDTRAGLLTPQEISAHILKKIKLRALQQIENIESAVITVPAYFDDSQRQATRDSARLAGIPLMRLLNEPTAAALAYGLANNKDGIVAVYDFGGGTFDLSILRLQKGVFQVLSTAGDTSLGGDDVDLLLANWISERSDKPVSLQMAREIKQRLSYEHKVEVTAKLQISRHTFNSLVAPLIDRTIDLCRQALADAGIDKNMISSLVLVGGSTRMPAIIERLGYEFPNSELHNQLDPDTTVALGAALQAATLAGRSGDRLLLDLLPLSLGVETMGSLVERIIPRNTTIPASRTQEFTTWKEGQRAMLIHVVQGERDTVDDCRSLAKFTLNGIPPRAAGAARIEVTFSVDADGILQVSAVETSTGTQAHIEVQPSSGLTEAEVRSMLEDAWKNADNDMDNRSNQQAVVEARRIIDATRGAIEEDGDLLDNQERAYIEKTIQQLNQMLQAGITDVEELVQKTEQLAETTNDFAARRMDKAIALALSGVSIDEVSDDSISNSSD